MKTFLKITGIVLLIAVCASLILISLSNRGANHRIENQLDSTFIQIVLIQQDVEKVKKNTEPTYPTPIDYLAKNYMPFTKNCRFSDNFRNGISALDKAEYEIAERRLGFCVEKDVQPLFKKHKSDDDFFYYSRRGGPAIGQLEDAFEDIVKHGAEPSYSSIYRPRLKPIQVEEEAIHIVWAWAIAKAHTEEAKHIEHARGLFIRDPGKFICSEGLKLAFPRRGWAIEWFSRRPHRVQAVCQFFALMTFDYHGLDHLFKEHVSSVERKLRAAAKKKAFRFDYLGCLQKMKGEKPKAKKGEKTKKK